MSSRVRTALAAAIVTALPGAALAQFPPPPGAPSTSVQDRWPDPPKSPQPERAAPAPAAPAASSPEPIQAAAPRNDAEAPPAPKIKPAPAPAAYVVACSGVFAKDTTHLKLAIKYNSRNITFGEVDGPDGSKIPGSILFPNDPKRRLEVLWSNDVARTDPSVIAINGKSQWAAPKGLKLGLGIAALEKANRKPFKISGFGADGIASVAGWEGGALGAMPGGCRVGMRLIADPKAAPDARSAVPTDKESLSNDAGVRALKPTVMEILIGY